MITEDEVQRALRNRRITRGIDQLSGHVIVCGMGRTGEILAQELTSFEEPFVVIDNDPAKTELAGEDLARLVVTGDATEEGTLETAGITRAKTLISVLPSDADNVFITLTARNLNPKLQIIAKAELRSSEKKLRQAGADRVVMPPVIGGRRMARMVTRPTTARWIDLFTDRSATMGIELDELVIAEQGGLVGKSVADAAVHRDHNLLILAVEHVDGSMDFNPGGNYVFQPNDTVILVGSREDTEAFRKSLKVKRL